MISAMPDMVTFPAVERHCPLTGTKLHCFATASTTAWTTAQSYYNSESNWWSLDRKSNAKTSGATTPPNCWGTISIL